MKKKFVSTMEQIRNEGFTAGWGDVLLLLITRRFGALADDVVARIRSAPLAELERWADRIFDAETLGDLFAD